MVKGRGPKLYCVMIEDCRYPFHVPNNSKFKQNSIAQTLQQQLFISMQHITSHALLPSYLDFKATFRNERVKKEDREIGKGKGAKEKKSFSLLSLEFFCPGERGFL